MFDPMCKQIVKECWEGCGDTGIQKKINAYAEKLAIWGKEITGNFSKRIQRCKKNLQV